MSSSTQPFERFFDLPLELRQKIYEQIFQSLSITTPHIGPKNKLLDTECPHQRSSSRPSTRTNMLLVNKRFHNECRPFFLRHTTFYLQPICCHNVTQPLPPNLPEVFPPITAIRHLALIDSWIDGSSTALRIAGYFATSVPQSTYGKLETLTLDWVFYGNKLKGPIKSFITEGLRCSKTIYFRATSIGSMSPARVIGIRIRDDAVAHMKGAFMVDLEDIVGTLRVKEVFTRHTTVYMTKTFRKIARKTVVLGQD